MDKVGVNKIEKLTNDGDRTTESMEISNTILLKRVQDLILLFAGLNTVGVVFGIIETVEESLISTQNELTTTVI